MQVLCLTVFVTLARTYRRTTGCDKIDMSARAAKFNFAPSHELLRQHLVRLEHSGNPDFEKQIQQMRSTYYGPILSHSVRA